MRSRRHFELVSHRPQQIYRERNMHAIASVFLDIHHHGTPVLRNVHPLAPASDLDESGVGALGQLVGYRLDHRHPWLCSGRWLAPNVAGNELESHWYQNGGDGKAQVCTARLLLLDRNPN